MVLVEQPEVVDVDQRDREWPLGRPSRLGLECELTDDRAVIERACQRIAPGRLHELGGLSGQATLGSPEDQEQQRRGDQRGRQRDEHDVPADRGKAVEDRDRIPPDPDDAEHLPVHRDREVLAQQGRGAERIRTGLGRDDGGLGRATDREREVADDRHREPADGRIVGGRDRAVGPAQLDAQDLTGPDQGRELRLQLGRLQRAPRSGGGAGRSGREVRGAKVGIDERSCRGGIAADHVSERGRREVLADHHGLRRGGDPDERDERAEHEDEQRRA